MAARKAEPYDHLFKLLLVGDAAVGKSRYSGRLLMIQRSLNFRPKCLRLGFSFGRGCILH